MKMQGTTKAIVLAVMLNISFYSYIRIHYGANDWILIGTAIILGLLGCFFGRQYDKVKTSAEKDTLTDVYNRRYVKDHFPGWTRLSDRKGKKLIVFIVDVDYFKTINDIYGHVTGDEVLRNIAKVLTLMVRTSDLVVRWGGDEFLVIMPCSCSNLSEAEHIQQQFTMELDQRLGELPLQVSASVGYGVYPDESSNLSELLVIADKWLYKQKNRKQGPISKNNLD
jgi:diguanylate cyclase (GGDEF)-like protein